MRGAQPDSSIPEPISTQEGTSLVVGSISNHIANIVVVVVVLVMVLQ